MRRTALAALFCLCACGRYADFILPLASPETERWLSFSESPAPVFPRGDATDVLNPSVVSLNGQLWNFYSEYDGRAWRTALATSRDGIEWTKFGRILAPPPGGYIAANGAAAYLDGRWFYWYVSGPESRPDISLATGSDPSKLATAAKPVLLPGPRGSFDEMAVADPYVIRLGATWYMYYLGQDRARRQQIGLARSSDGVVWEKLRANPVLAMGELGGMDDRGLGEPAVWQSQGWYWMLFTGRDPHENRSLGLARSRDGVQWERGPENFHGSQAWDAKVLCDPTVLVQGGRIRVWFGGGDVPSPDQNLHGQIGIGDLK